MDLSEFETLLRMRDELVATPDIGAPADPQTKSLLERFAKERDRVLNSPREVAPKGPHVLGAIVKAAAKPFDKA